MPDQKNGQRYRTKHKEMLDAICHKYYKGRKGATEAVLNANPGLAKLGPVIPDHTEIFLPDLSPPENDGPVSLWD
jgi:phage tail protein X